MEGLKRIGTRNGLQQGELQLLPGYPPNEEVLDTVKLLSHDLRGPLISVMATLKLLIRGHYGKIEPSVENSLKDLQERVAHLIEMSEECLERFLSADGSPSSNAELYDLREDIIRPILTELSPEIRTHDLRVDNRLDRAPACRIPVRGNKAWLKAIFRNLLRNAIRYGDAGGTIAFGFEIRGASYRLNIYNSGNPIPEGWRDRLFTKAASVHNQNRPKAEGMGLGLYLIRRIVQKLGGKIWYEAKEHGSNFVLTLPIGAQ